MKLLRKIAIIFVWLVFSVIDIIMLAVVLPLALVCIILNSIIGACTLVLKMLTNIFYKIKGADNN